MRSGYRSLAHVLLYTGVAGASAFSSHCSLDHSRNLRAKIDSSQNLIYGPKAEKSDFTEVDFFEDLGLATGLFSAGVGLINIVEISQAAVNYRRRKR